jgi:hypothetical protein
MMKGIKMSKIVRYLDKNDLIFILADYFKVEKKDVNLFLFNAIEGYGFGEHEVPSLRVEVNISKDFEDK